MKYAWLGCLFFGSLLFAGPPDSDTNVNSRYKVETVIVTGNGWTADLRNGQDEKLSISLKKRLVSLIGDHLNPTALDELGKQLRQEFHARTVSHHVLRGASPEYVRVVFEVNDRDRHFDVSVPKFLYNSRQGWTGAVEGTATIRQNGFTFGLVSDGDELAERYAGLVARYERERLGADWARFRLAFESYHQQWNRATLEQFAPEQPSEAAVELTSSPYRTRWNIEPVITLTIAEPLTVSVGASFQQFQSQFPSAGVESADAVVSAIRYHQQVEGSGNQHDINVGYALRAGTKALDSDYVYSRHAWDFSYMLRHGRHTLVDEFSVGAIGGRAPLFDRLYLGNSSTLRGWNKFDLDPLGGNRMIHNSVEYRYGVFQVFYDAGAIWDSGVTPATPRHGVGAGLRSGAFALAVAFPVRSGRADPIFMMGMNY